MNQHVFSWLTVGARASFEFEREPCLPCSPSPAGLGGSLEKFLGGLCATCSSGPVTGMGTVSWLCAPEPRQLSVFSANVPPSASEAGVCSSK